LYYQKAVPQGAAFFAYGFPEHNELFFVGRSEKFFSGKRLIKK